VRGRDRGSYIVLDAGQFSDQVLARRFPVLEFGYGDQLLGAVIRNRERNAASARDLVDRRFDVVRRVVTPLHDQEILDTAHDEQSPS
jgi:hypothetical protein